MENLLELQNIEKEFDRYFLQINRIKLQDYVEYGLIAPDRYLGDEIQKDIQSKNPNFLLASDGYLEDLNEHQILLELIFTDEEKAKLIICAEVCYFDFPIPITRIKKIYTQNKNITKHIIVNLETSEKGYLPKELFDVYSKSKKILFEKRFYTSYQSNGDANDYSTQIRKFDKRMGMFSFMKNTELYYCNETKNISNYSKHYFIMLSYFLQESLESESFEHLNLIKQNEAFKDLLHSNKQIDKEFLEQVLQSIENQEIKEIFSNLLQVNSTRKTLPILLEKGAELYFLIGLVYYFRQKDANKKDNFKIDMKNLIPYDMAEISLAVLGIYLGYTNLRATETIEIDNKVFQTIFGRIFNIKFKLDSKLDYITIESIYNYCFDTNNKKGHEFDYLEYPKNTTTLQMPNTKDFKNNYEVYKSKKYFDVTHTKIIYCTFEEIVSKKFQKYEEENVILGKHHIFSFIAKHMPNMIKVSNYNQKFQLYSEKSAFFEELKSEQNKKKQDEFFSLLEVDGKL